MYVYVLKKEEDFSPLIASIISLKAVTSQPNIGCVITPNLMNKYAEPLKEFGIQIFNASTQFLYIEALKHNVDNPELLAVISVIDYFGEKSVYIDSHSFIFKNINDLFYKFTGTMNYDPSNIDSNYIGLWVYDPVPYISKQLLKDMNNDSNGIIIRQWLEQYYEFQSRPKLHLPIEYSTNLLTVDSYITNPLFNFNNTKILFSALPGSNITFLTKNPTLDFRVKSILDEYLYQYNLLISTCKTIYSQYSDLFISIGDN